MCCVSSSSFYISFIFCGKHSHFKCCRGRGIISLVQMSYFSRYIFHSDKFSSKAEKLYTNTLLCQLDWFFWTTVKNIHHPPVCLKSARTSVALKVPITLGSLGLGLLWNIVTQTSQGQLCMWEASVLEKLFSHSHRESILSLSLFFPKHQFRTSKCPWPDV